MIPAFSFPAPPDIHLKLLAWADTFETVVYLDNHQYPATHGWHQWELLVGAGAAHEIARQAGSAFAELEHFQRQHQGRFIFGYLGYDLKNEVEQLTSAGFDGLGWPDLYFFAPAITVGVRRGAVFIFTEKNQGMSIAEQILGAVPLPPFMPRNPIVLQARLPKSRYIESVAAIRQHIREGDIYEMNFCQEFYAEGVQLPPAAVFQRLNAVARSPFSAYFKQGPRYLLCASPERFLKKEGDALITQPIKGTRRRSADPAEDARIRAELAASEKDRSENVMIVDLVRNDLARHCLPGTITVSELFGIYSFPTVHQMISTVRGLLPAGDSGIGALRDAFPMGSMTGAPKVMAMSLIERYERTRRGLYSGAVGYFLPNGDFDFNVVIRSLQYQSAARYLSCSVGGAIVYESDPEQEYEECLVKMSAVRKALQ